MYSSTSYMSSVCPPDSSLKLSAVQPLDAAHLETTSPPRQYTCKLRPIDVILQRTNA